MDYKIFQEVKKRASLDALKELIEEYKHNIKILEKLERLEENEARGLKKIIKRKNH